MTDLNRGFTLNLTDQGGAISDRLLSAELHELVADYLVALGLTTSAQVAVDEATPPVLEYRLADTPAAAQYQAGVVRVYQLVQEAALRQQATGEPLRLPIICCMRPGPLGAGAMHYQVAMAGGEALPVAASYLADDPMMEGGSLTLTQPTAGGMLQAALLTLPPDVQLADLANLGLTLQAAVTFGYRMTFDGPVSYEELPLVVLRPPAWENGPSAG